MVCGIHCFCCVLVEFHKKISDVKVHYVKLEAVPKETYYLGDSRVRMC